MDNSEDSIAASYAKSHITKIQRENKFSSVNRLLRTSERLSGGADKNADKRETTSTEYDDDFDDDDDEDEVVVSKQTLETPKKTNLLPAASVRVIPKKRSKKKIFAAIKISVLFWVWLFFTVALIISREHEDKKSLILVSANESFDRIIKDQLAANLLEVKLHGSFILQEFELTEQHETQHESKPYLTVQVQRFDSRTNTTEDASKAWHLQILPKVEKDDEPVTSRENIFKVNADKDTTLRLHMESNNFNESIVIEMTVNASPMDKAKGVIYAALILAGLYILIIWELMDRTFAALIASSTAIGVLSVMHSRPTMATIIDWIDMNTLLLLFGMMILVAIFSETGIFDYLAVFAYKITKGNVWPLITVLCIFTAILSSFLDNVTMVLLMTPVVIRLCEVMHLKVTKVLIMMVIFSNIGGTMTAVGDPPNVIIASNRFLASHGVEFLTFFLHMLPVVVVIMAAAMFQLRLQFWKPESLHVTAETEAERLRHDLDTWKRAAEGVKTYTKSEIDVRQNLLQGVKELRTKLRDNKKDKKMGITLEPVEDFEATLHEMTSKYPIKHKILLYKSSAVLAFVIMLFFLHSLPMMQGISLAWAAYLGAMCLLILADKKDMGIIMARVEWATLLFFAALFILMEALAELGLIEWIGNVTVSIILQVADEARLAVALMILLWVTALTSAFVDNIPVTTMMVKVTITLATNESLNLPLTPLVWAMALGACLGGNGTLIGASANVVCAGIAEQHGHKFTFMEFLKIGFPVMIMSIVLSTVYLMISHVLFKWND